jgi:hypothetical protein
VRGTVVDASGSPVSGGYVTALGMPSFRSYETVSTDATGTFALTGLMPGGLMMIAGHDQKGTGQATNIKAGDLAVRIQLKGVGVITGKVVRKGGTTPVTSFLLRPYTSGPFQYVYSRATTFNDPDEFTRRPAGLLPDRREGHAAHGGRGADETKDVRSRCPRRASCGVDNANGITRRGGGVVRSGGFRPCRSASSTSDRTPRAASS